MEYPNPKDYPFNYVIEWADDETEEFENYPDAESFIDAWCDAYHLDEGWREGYELPSDWHGRDGSDYHFKVIWKSPDDAKQLELDLLRIQDEEFGDPLDEMRRRYELGHGFLIRERKAFDAAVEEARDEAIITESGASSEDTGEEHVEDDYDPDEDDVCAFCGEEFPDGHCPTHGPTHEAQ